MKIGQKTSLPVYGIHPVDGLAGLLFPTEGHIPASERLAVGEKLETPMKKLIDKALTFDLRMDDRYGLYLNRAMTTKGSLTLLFTVLLCVAGQIVFAVTFPGLAELEPEMVIDAKNVVLFYMFVWGFPFMLFIWLSYVIYMTCRFYMNRPKFLGTPPR